MNRWMEDLCLSSALKIRLSSKMNKAWKQKPQRELTSLELEQLLSKTESNRSWRRCGDVGTLTHCWGERKQGQPQETARRHLVTSERELSMTAGFISKRQPISTSKGCLLHQALCNTVHTSQDTESPQGCSKRCTDTNRRWVKQLLPAGDRHGNRHIWRSLFRCSWPAHGSPPSLSSFPFKQK